MSMTARHGSCRLINSIQRHVSRMVHFCTRGDVLLLIMARLWRAVCVKTNFASEASAVTNCANLRFLVYIFIYLYICMSPYDRQPLIVKARPTMLAFRLVYIYMYI